MDEKNINIIALGGGILLTSLGLYFVTKSVLNQIRAKAEDKLEDNLNAEIVTGGGSTQQQGLETQQAKLYNPYQDVLALRGYLEGYNLVGYPVEVASIINKLTDEELKKLATYYKLASYKYGEKKTLYQQLVDEFDGYLGLGGTMYDATEKRLASLGLR
jgi:hypothetical protein